MGAPYVWGGCDWRGVDCSGLGQLVAAALGRLDWGAMDRTADRLMRDEVPELHYGPAGPMPAGGPAPGSLVFAVDDKGHAYHMGVAIDASTIVEASSKRCKVVIGPMWTKSTVRVREPLAPD